MKICNLKINGLVLGGIAGLIMGKLKRSDGAVFLTDEFPYVIFFAVFGELPPTEYDYIYLGIDDEFVKAGRRYSDRVYLDVTLISLDTEMNYRFMIWNVMKTPYLATIEWYE